VHAENWHFPSVLGLSDEGKLLGMRTSFAFPAKNMFLQYAPKATAKFVLTSQDAPYIMHEATIEMGFL
jgi:hypothetical protein